MEFISSAAQPFQTQENISLLKSHYVLNSIPMAYNRTDGRGRPSDSGFVMSSSNPNIKMKKGDKVWIRTHYNYGQFARGGDRGEWCNFSGFKLYRL